MRRRYGKHAEQTKQAYRRYIGLLRRVKKTYLYSLETMRLSKPADFWRLIKPPKKEIKVDQQRLFQHYRNLLELPNVTGVPE